MIVALLGAGQYASVDVIEIGSQVDEAKNQTQHKHDGSQDCKAEREPR